ncbi:MAG: cytochrome-c oxidase, cbb3-type subunit III [Pseudomonadota bacterium]
MSKAPRKQPKAPAKPVVETTGHSWDGIEELNNPLPRWWLWTLYATIVWGIAYTVFFPAWPLISSATSGLLGFSTRAEVAADIAAVDAQNSEVAALLATADLSTLSQDDPAYHFGVSGGAAVFRANCSQCHGSGAAGVQAAGYPNLLDDDWLWGGTLEEIEYTIRHGIRNEIDWDARWSEMPAFAEVLSDEEQAAVVEHVLAISDQQHDVTQLAAGAAVFEAQCSSCHGLEGRGDPTQGAPNLTDAIWLYGGSREDVAYTVANARFGVMPPWGGRLDEEDIKAVTLYIHQLGGGQ